MIKISILVDLDFVDLIIEHEQVGHRVLLYTAVSSPSVKEKFHSAKFAKNPKLAKQPSNATPFSNEDVTIR